MVDFEQHKGLVGMTFNKYFTKVKKHEEDLMQCGYLGLWKACQTFDESKGFAFSTYAVKCIRNEMAIWLRSELKYWYYTTDIIVENEDGEMQNIVELFADDGGMQEVEDDCYLDGILNFTYGDIIKEYVNGRTLSEIAKDMGISRQAVSKIIQRRMTIIWEKIK